MFIVEGKIIDGYGAASPNIKWQMPLLISAFPEIKDCYRGSINLELAKPIKIITPDFTSKPIKWFPDRNDIEEEFSFTRIKFENNSSLTAAWIYDPHNSPHRRDPFHLEIIAPLIQLRRDKVCRIHIDRKYELIDFYFVI